MKESYERIYIASRASVPERAALWRAYRRRGVVLTSTWIDEAGEGQTEDLSELWERIVFEVAAADRLVLYAEAEDFPLKGAFIEVGIALGLQKPITVCLPNVELQPRSFRPIGSWVNHPKVTRCDNIDQAMGLVPAEVNTR